MNGDEIDQLDEENQDVQPIQSPVVTPPDVTQVRPRNVMYMGQNVEPWTSYQVGPPSVSAIPWLEQQRGLQQETAANEMLKEARSDPDLESSSAAIQSAIKYQGMRGYQQDLNNGVPAATAMAKWGPMLFYQSKSASPVSTAMRMQQPVFRNAGGGIYKITPEGQATAVVQPRVKSEPLSPEDKVSDEDLKMRIQELRKKSMDTLNMLPEDREQSAREAERLVEQRKQLYRVKPPQSKERIVTDKRGRKWIYTGTMSDPTKDTDRNNWKLSQ